MANFDTSLRSQVKAEIIDMRTANDVQLIFKVPQLEADIKQANEDIVALRTTVRAQATKTVDTADGEKVPDPVNLSKAFVTFKQPRQAQICLNLQFNSDSGVLCTSVPPEPRDLLWNDLTADPTVQAARDVIGYALIVGLYFNFHL